MINIFANRILTAFILLHKNADFGFILLQKQLVFAFIILQLESKKAVLKVIESNILW